MNKLEDLIGTATVIGEIRKNARIAYVLPSMKEARDVAWPVLKDMADKAGETAIDRLLRIDISNGARITLYGADSPRLLCGTYIDFALISENVRGSFYKKEILPALAERSGEALWEKK